jgi:hypothetical protein
MRHKTITAKIFITILVSGMILWIGGNIVRNAIAYDIFVPGTALELKNWYSDEAKLTTVSLFRTAGFYTITGFCMTFVSSVFLFVYLRKYLKFKGWLFMSLILIFLASPVEFYLMYYDIKIILAFNAQEIRSFNDKVIEKYFIGRYEDLSLPATLSFLASITAVLLAIWKPLDKKYIKEENDLNNIGKNELEQDKEQHGSE